MSLTFCPSGLHFVDVFGGTRCTKSFDLADLATLVTFVGFFSLFFETYVGGCMYVCNNATIAKWSHSIQIMEPHETPVLGDPR